MRSTLTLDDDLDARMAHLLQNSNATMREILNEAMRCGLAEILRPQKRKPFRSKTYSMGRLLIDVDNVTEAIAYAEGDDFK